MLVDRLPHEIEADFSPMGPGSQMRQSCINRGTKP
jgi:hypothetical protein